MCRTGGWAAAEEDEEEGRKRESERARGGVHVTKCILITEQQMSCMEPLCCLNSRTPALQWAHFTLHSFGCQLPIWGREGV